MVKGGRRGGARIGAGRKSGKLESKIVEGKVAEGISTARMPDDDENFERYFKPFLKSVTPDSDEYFAVTDICVNVYSWLLKFGCEKLVPNELIAQYAINSARWQQSEMYLSKCGLMGTHPTTGGEMASPYINVSIQYQKQANTAWYQIYQIVKENSAEAVTSLADSNDEMEQLLAGGKPTRKHSEN